MIAHTYGVLKEDYNGKVGTKPFDFKAGDLVDIQVNAQGGGAGYSTKNYLHINDERIHGGAAGVFWGTNMMRRLPMVVLTAEEYVDMKRERNNEEI